MVDELAVVYLLLTAVALVSCLSVADRRTIRRMPRALWVIVIVLVPLAGSIAWFLAGRPRTTSGSRTGWRVALGLPEPPRPRAPEDDADFLRSLDQPAVESQGEEDLNRREDEPRRGDPTADG